VEKERERSGPGFADTVRCGVETDELVITGEGGSVEEGRMPSRGLPAMGVRGEAASEGSTEKVLGSRRVPSGR
jgi:hypothetical protein